MPNISNYALSYGANLYSAFASSPYDLIITEGAPFGSFPSITDAELRLLQGQGRTVVGYVNLSVVDQTRPYWNTGWTVGGSDTAATTTAAPSWLRGQPANEFGIVTRYWEDGWKSIVINQAVELVRRGYDGVFLDDPLSYYNLALVAGQPPVTTLANWMMELILQIDAAIRAVNPSAHLVVNGAPYIMGDSGNANSATAAAYLAAVDAVLLENQTPTVWDFTRNTFPGETEVLALSTATDRVGFAASAWVHNVIPYAAPDGNYAGVGSFISAATAGADRLIGGDGPNLLDGLGGDDRLEGRNGSDRLFGNSGNDVLVGGGGSDVLDGGAGIDTAVYGGLFFGYSSVTRTRVAGGREGGADTLTGVERLRFLDGTISYESGSAVWTQDDATVAVARLYQACLGRVPDINGLEHYRLAVDQGYDLYHFTRVMIESPEFYARFGNLSNQQFVEQIYRFVLGRDGDAGGVASYTAALSQGYTRADVVLVFSESPENRVRYQSTWENLVRHLEDNRYSTGAPDLDGESDAPGPLVLPLQPDDFLVATDPRQPIIVRLESAPFDDMPVRHETGSPLNLALVPIWSDVIDECVQPHHESIAL